MLFNRKVSSQHPVILKKDRYLKFDISGTAKAAASSLYSTAKSIPVSMMVGLNHHVGKSVRRLYDNGTTIVYYMTTGATIGALTGELIGNLTATISAANSVSRIKTALVKNDTRCEAKLGHGFKFDSCHNNATLDKQLEALAFQTSLAEMPFVDFITNNWLLHGALGGAVIGFIYATFMIAMEEEQRKQPAKKTSLRNVLATHSNEISGHAVWMSITACMSYVSTLFPFMISMLTYDANLQRHFFNASVSHAGNYPVCNVTFTGNGCGMLACPDKNMTETFCSNMLSVIMPTIGIGPLRQGVPMAIASVGGYAIGFFRAASQIQRELDEKEAKNELTQGSDLKTFRR